MKSKRSIQVVSVCFLIAIFTHAAHSQVTLQAGAGVGLRLPIGDLSGETTEYYAGTTYGLSTGYNLQAKARVALPGVTLAGGIEYGHMSNRGEGEPGHGTVEVAQSVFTIKAGPEFSFSIPAAPLVPYIGANFAWHSISGTTTFQGLTKVSSGTHDVESTSRIGFGVNAGLVISLGSGLGLDLGGEYAFINPVSKEWTAVQKAGRIDSYRALNDDTDPLYMAGNVDHFVPGSRSMSSFQIMATIMFAL